MVSKDYFVNIFNIELRHDHAVALKTKNFKTFKKIFKKSVRSKHLIFAPEVVSCYAALSVAYRASPFQSTN